MKRKFLLLLILSIIVYNLLVFFLYYFEAGFEASNIKNIADAYWYSIVTLTTVGYGDFYPVTFLGRIIGFLFVIGSLGILSILITDLNLKITEYIQKRKEGYFGTIMEKHCVIIGWNSFSQGITDQIIKANEQIAIITDSKSDVENIRHLYPKEKCFVLLSNLENYSLFEKVNITKARKVYLGFDNDTETLVYTIKLKKKFENIDCVIALDNIELKSSFNFLGVKDVVSKNEIASKFVASYIFEPYVATLTEDLLSTSIKNGDMDIHQEEIIKNSNLIGQEYIKLFSDLKIKHDVALIGIARENKILNNPKDLILKEQDYLIFIGDYLAKGNVKNAILDS